MGHTIVRIETDEHLQQALSVRREVFVIEQGVPAHAEFDAFEDSCVHFVALDIEGRGCGAARWRTTDAGVKLERFAVLKSHRGCRVGFDLVSAVLADIVNHPEAKTRRRYLHAQVRVMPFYAKFGFTPYGERFDECQIEHQAMELHP